MSDTKESLLARIRAGHEELEAALARIPEEQMQTPILHDGWSVQDTLGHLAFWQDLLGARFAALRAGQTPDPVTDMDALNARILTDFRHLSLEEVREREQAAYQQIIDMIENATDKELFAPDYFSWTNGNPFQVWIPGDTWEHYAEHLPELQAWLDQNTES
jgi:hypothetical protein